MLELFTNGLQFKFNEISRYQGKNQIKPLSYLLILVLGLSLILIGFQASQVNLGAFGREIMSAKIKISDNQVLTPLSDKNSLDNLSQETGITIEKTGLNIKNVGSINYELLRNLSDNTEPAADLGQLVKAGHNDLMNITFLTLYLKTLPFIIMSLLTEVILSQLLKKSVTQRQLTNGQALTMTVSLLTLPALVYLCLRVAGIKDAMALFIFVAVSVMISFLYSRQLNVGEQESLSNEK